MATRSGIYRVGENATAIVFTRLKAAAAVVAALATIIAAALAAVRFANELQKPMVERWFHELAAPAQARADTVHRELTPRHEHDNLKSLHGARLDALERDINEMATDIRYIRDRIDRLVDNRQSRSSIDAAPLRPRQSGG